MTAAVLLHHYGYSDAEIAKGVDLIRAALHEDTTGPPLPEEIALLTMYVVGQKFIDAGYEATLTRTKP